ncbi:MAG: hypothetical protein CMB62_00665 [Euryarchaeota archaeon]|nr:hypothetical protein [Euryarchaeota archaeon]
MRGQRYQALIVVILLLTALPYSPFLSRASSIEKDPLAEKDIDGDGIPDPPFRDSDGDGLSDDYEIALGFDPNDFDMDNDGISDMLEEQLWDNRKNLDSIPDNLEELYDCDGDLDGDGITNCMDPDADGDGFSDQEEMTDSDGDGIPDMYENMIDHLDPNNPDSDGDGIPDKEDQDPPLPGWAEEMANSNDWTPQPDSNGMGGLEGFYPLAVLGAVKFTVTCDNCEDPTSNPQYWRTVGKTIYDNGYDSNTDTYTRSQWCPAPGCENYDIETGVIENPGYWSTGSSPYTYDYLITHPDVTSQEYEYTMTWIMPVQGYLSTSLYTNNVFIANSVTMDSAFNLKVEGYAQSYKFTMTEYNIPENVKQAANAPDDFASELTELPQFPVRPGPNNDVYDLAASITEGKETDYQKAEAIMYYLRSNYYYNINGTLTPDGEDFVDYFLFGNSGNDGKCTNFASAFTVLSRISGIPTRYVEGNGPGEVITPEGWQDSGYGESTGYQIEENTRIVTMLNGHAYAEVLFDEIGWLTFEPTSSTTCPTCDQNGATTTGDDDTVVGDGTQPGTDYEISDADDDGLSDEFEIGIGTDPNNPDTDGDTLPDGAESDTGTFENPEKTGTNPLLADTDGDGLNDNEEIFCLYYTYSGKFCSHPLDSDTDNDGLSDGDEYHGIWIDGVEIKTDPVDHDTDDDGLLDGLELGVFDNIFEREYNSGETGISCAKKDGLNFYPNCLETWQPDEDELTITDPKNPDSDGDGLDDGVEDANANGKLDDGETAADLEDTDGGGRSDFEEIFTDSTDPRNSEDDIGDSDGDGLFDHREEELGTNVTNPDTDGDGLDDGEEVTIYFTDPLDEDTDDDDLTDYTEITGLGDCEWTSPKTFVLCDYNEDGLRDENDGTNPLIADTDGGGTIDGWEILDGTNPLTNNTDDIAADERDTDGDGLTDLEENTIYDTDMNNPDTDDDGLEDGDEVNTYETNPDRKDTDGDGLSDYDEIFTHETEPDNRDTDDDGLEDGEEINNYETNPILADTDGDGLEDGLEINTYFTNASNSDTDGDELNDGTEINIYFTNATNSDTDGDGLDDGDEITGSEGYVTNATKNDTDGDGLLDGEEIITYGTDPTSNDTDSDGLLDIWELTGNFPNCNWMNPDTGIICDFDGNGILNEDDGTDPNNPDTDGGAVVDGVEIYVDSSNPLDNSDDDTSDLDQDGDGLTDGQEFVLGTDELNPDSDGDGLTDGDEINNLTSDPLNSDSDGDGLDDGDEVNTYFSNLTLEDTDGDGLTDGEEVNDYDTSPTNNDTDSDGLLDGEEIITYGTDPTLPDTDGDGLTDGEEINDYSTEPLESDTDGDELSDGEEVNDYGSNPNVQDSDGDGLNDGEEVDDYGSDPMSLDSDGDGLGDGSEVDTHGTEPGNSDTDGDGLDDGDEIEESTDPNDIDSDDDLLNDGDEVNVYGSDPLEKDTDGDNLEDYNETAIHFTDPTLSDTDGDGLSDDYEIFTHETNPTLSDTDDDGLDDGIETNTGIYVDEEDTGSNPTSNDTDFDGLTDGDEIDIGTDPNNSDTDGGGVEDGIEWEIDGTNPVNNPADDNVLDNDDDGDGLNNGKEQVLGTDPNDPDSDDDGLPDGYEVDTVISNPLLEDSDSDGLLDIIEWNLTDTDPLESDSDGDLLNDGEENNTYGTDPNNWDSDGDGLSDYAEIFTHLTEPLDPDTDDDGLEDGEEINSYGSDPLDKDTDDDEIEDYDEIFTHETKPDNKDTDDDGLEDGEEINDYGTNPILDDTDGDGLSDYDEIFTHETDPLLPDTDGDGLDDGLEITFGINPLAIDSDSDGLNDSWEYARFSEGSNYSPGNNDTDGDETLDGDEDIDTDGLTNLEEINTYFTNPLEEDTDDDELWDGDEINPWEINKDGVNNQYNYPSDPKLSDSDGDGLDDYEEVTQSNDTFNSRTDPDDSDTDNDGLTDYYEVSWYWNITGEDDTPRLYHQVQGWNTSNPRNDNTDDDAWEDGDIDEENPVYGYFEEEDPPWGSPPARAETPTSPPAQVNKTDTFIWSWFIKNPETEEPYGGIEIQAYLNESDEENSPSYIIGSGVSDENGFYEVICNISSTNPELKAGDWKIQLKRPYQSYNDTVNLVEGWSPKLDIKVIGNVTIDYVLPTTAASSKTTIITGTLLENENIPIKNEYLSLTFDDGTYYTLTNDNGIFSVEINTPDVEDAIYAIEMRYNGTENLTEEIITDNIRIINASVELRFDNSNEDSFNLDEEYDIKGTIFGDEGAPPTGTIELRYGDYLLGETNIIGNQEWNVEFTVPSNASWGNTILTATYSGNDIYPTDIIVNEIIVKGKSNLTLDESISLRTDTIRIRGNLTDHNNQSISDKAITIFLGEKALGSVITESDGSYSFSYNASNEPAGLHQIRAEIYNSPTLVGNLTVNKLTLLATPTLIFDSPSKCSDKEEITEKKCRAARGFQYNLSGILVDELGNPITNTSIEFFTESNGFSPPFITDLTGSFNYNIFVDEGQTEIFIIDIKIEDNSEQPNLIETSFELEIIPQSQTQLTSKIDNDSNYRGENVSVSGFLEGASGTISNQRVCLIIDSEIKDCDDTDIDGSYNVNFELYHNSELGNFNISVIYNETDSYLSSSVNNSFNVKGTTTFENVKVEGDWFNNEIRRGGVINVYGILVDDLGNRINDNITVRIGNVNLETSFTNETTFISTGMIPNDYRNNRTVIIGYNGSDYLDGNKSTSKHSIMVESKISFDFEPKNVFPGDTVNVSVWLEEDNGNPLPQTDISVLVNLFYGKEIKMDTVLEYNLTTDNSGFSKFSFEFPVDASSASIEASFVGGYIDAYEDTELETELTTANVAISITKSPEAKEPFDINKYLPLFIGIPAALLVTAYYLYWTQKHKYEVRNLIKQMQKELNKDEDYRQIIIKSYHQLLNILDRYGFIKTKTQTVREFTEVMRAALPIPTQSVKLLTSLFEIARYSGIKPKVVDEFGMEMIDGSYNIWCVEAINNLHEVEIELNKGLKEGKVSRFTNIFGMRSAK